MKNHACPTICVIVLNYFDHKSTQKCVESLIAQQLNTLYIVDNSGDRKEADLSRKIVEQLEQKKLFFNVELQINTRNLGFGGGVNTAVLDDKAKTGGHDYYLLLNNDAILVPNTIAVLVNKCRKNANIALVAPQINWGGRLISYYGYNKYWGHVTTKPSKYAQPYISGCCLLVDKTLLNHKGQIFDEAFFMYGEDIELNWRAIKMGKEICCADEITIFHEGTGASSQGQFFYEYHVARGHVLLGLRAKKSIFKKTPYILGRVIYLFLRGVVRSIRYRSYIPLQAFLMSWFPIKVRVN